MGLMNTPLWGIYFAMKLDTYLKQHRISEAAIAAELGVSKSGVRKWRYGERVPRPTTMAKIVRYTNGDVTPLDFLPITADKAEPAA